MIQFLYVVFVGLFLTTPRPTSSQGTPLFKGPWPLSQGCPCIPSCFDPLSPNSDQQQFSPNDIHTLSRDEVMRINLMIT